MSNAEQVSNGLDGLALTPNMKHTLDLIAEGLMTKQMAPRLGVSESAIKIRISALLDRSGLINRTQLAQAWTDLKRRRREQRDVFGSADFHEAVAQRIADAWDHTADPVDLCERFAVLAIEAVREALHGACDAGPR